MSCFTTRWLSCIMLAGAVLLIWATASADEGQGGMAGAFLRLPPDARSSAMGGAYTSIAEGGCAPIWNPAVLGYTEGYTVETSLAKLSMGRNLGYISGVAELPGNAGMGGGWIRAWVNDLPRYDEGGSMTGQFSFSQNAFFVSFGRRIIPQLSAGLTLKFFYHFLDDVGATGLSFDIGVMAKPLSGLTLGLVFQDIKGKESWESGYMYGIGKEDELPMTIRGGGSYSLFNGRFLLALEASGQLNRSPKYHFGVQVLPKEDLALRAGYDNGLWTIGGGLAFPFNGLSLGLDYAYTQDSLSVSAGHRLSLSFNF